MNLLETEREEMHRNYRVAERKFEATEAKLQAALARLGERPPLPKKEKFVPDEQQLAEQRAQQASLERLARIRASRQRISPPPPPPPPPRLMAASEYTPSAAKYLADAVKYPKLSATPSRTKAIPRATSLPSHSHYGTKVKKTAKKNHAPSAQSKAWFGPHAPLAAQYEPESFFLSAPPGCPATDSACALGGADASVDSVVDCVRCATYRQRHAPERTALASGLQVAQRTEIARRARSPRAWTSTPLWLEFGAWSGRSARIIRDAAFAINKTDGVYSFDSFEGLPEDWRADPLKRPNVTRAFLSRGSFSRRGVPPYHEAGVHWEIGWFNVTLGAFLQRHPQAPISLVHIDCDLYSSTASVFQALEKRLTPDAVIVFDELVNYPEYPLHEAKAFVELLKRTGRSYKVLGAGPRHIMRSPDALRNLLTDAVMSGHARKPGTLFGGTSNEDVAVRLLPAAASPASFLWGG